MSENEVTFKYLESKPVGSDTVVFRLEDGAVVKVKIDLSRAGVATNYRNPDGTLHYNIAINTNVTVIPADKTFRVPKSRIAKGPQWTKQPTTGAYA